MGILESILININNITNLRNRLRTKLRSMYIVKDGASLEKCVESVENIEFYGEALSRPLNTIGASYTIPKGYHSGAGSVGIGSNAVKYLIPENLREGVVVLGVEGTLSEKAPTGSTFVNLIKNGSFETNEAWTTWEGENSFSTSEKYDGNRSFRMAVSNLASQAIPTPIVGHKYYAREYIKSTGEISPEDCRFEIYGGDGIGLNWIFGLNLGNFPQWTIISGIAEIDVVNASSYTLRTFAVNPKSTVYLDGIMLIDLTACCGAGNEPSKEWCDLNIPYFEGEKSLEWVSGKEPEYQNIKTRPYLYNSADGTLIIGSQDAEVFNEGMQYQLFFDGKLIGTSIGTGTYQLEFGFLKDYLGFLTLTNKTDDYFINQYVLSKIVLPENMRPSTRASGPPVENFLPADVATKNVVLSENNVSVDVDMYSYGMLDSNFWQDGSYIKAPINIFAYNIGGLFEENVAYDLFVNNSFVGTAIGHGDIVLDINNLTLEIDDGLLSIIGFDYDLSNILSLKLVATYGWEHRLID